MRVDATELRCRVVGEGGNLGFTQLGRIEAARRGIQLNTDAIDNSAGVDTSDHEVNIKILLDEAVRDGELDGGRARRAAARHDRRGRRRSCSPTTTSRTSCSATRARRTRAMLPVHQRLMRALEAAGELDRALEFLPERPRDRGAARRRPRAELARARRARRRT